MLNMLKYQLYRFSRSMSTYIAPVIMAVFSVVIVVMNATTPGAQSGDMALSNFMTLTDFAAFNFITMGFTMIYSAWAVIYAYGEFQQGYIRSIASSVKNKCAFFFSHMAVCAVMFVILAVVNSAVTMISARLLVDNVQFGDILFLLKFLAIQLYIHLILTALLLFIVYLARNIFIPLIVAFAIPMGLEGLPLTTIENLITKLMGSSGSELMEWLHHTSVYWNVYVLELDMHNGDPLHRYFIMGGIMLVLYSVLACLSITKKDIK